MSETVTSKDHNPDPEKLKESIKGILDHVVDLTVELLMGGKLPAGEKKNDDDETTDTSEKTDK